MGLKEKLSEKLRSLREERAWSQAQAAQAAGIPFRTYVQFEYKTRFPRVEQLEKLAEGFGLDPSDLLRKDAPNVELDQALDQARQATRTVLARALDAVPLDILALLPEVQNWDLLRLTVEKLARPGQARPKKARAAG